MAAGLAEGVEYGHAYNAGSERAIMVGGSDRPHHRRDRQPQPRGSERQRLRPPIPKCARCLLIQPVSCVRPDGLRGSSCGKSSKDGRVVASSPLRQAVPPAEEPHHVIAAAALSRCVPAEVSRKRIHPDTHGGPASSSGLKTIDAKRALPSNCEEFRLPHRSTCGRPRRPSTMNSAHLQGRREAPRRRRRPAIRCMRRSLVFKPG